MAPETTPTPPLTSGDAQPASSKKLPHVSLPLTPAVVSTRCPFGCPESDRRQVLSRVKSVHSAVPHSPLALPPWSRVLICYPCLFLVLILEGMSLNATGAPTAKIPLCACTPVLDLGSCLPRGKVCRSHIVGAVWSSADMQVLGPWRSGHDKADLLVESSRIRMTFYPTEDSTLS